MLAVLVARQPRLHPVAAVDARVAPPQCPHRRRATPACRAHQSVTVHPSSLAHSRSDRLTRPAEPSSSRFDGVLGRPCAAHRPTTDRARAGDQTNVMSRTDRDPPPASWRVPARAASTGERHARGSATNHSRHGRPSPPRARPRGLPLQVGGRELARPPRSVTSRPSPAPDSPLHRRPAPSWTTSMKVFTDSRSWAIDRSGTGCRVARQFAPVASRFSWSTESARRPSAALSKLLRRASARQKAWPTTVCGNYSASPSDAPPHASHDLRQRDGLSSSSCRLGSSMETREHHRNPRRPPRRPSTDHATGGEQESGVLAAGAGRRSVPVKPPPTRRRGTATLDPPSPHMTCGARPTSRLGRRRRSCVRRFVAAFEYSL